MAQITAGNYERIEVVENCLPMVRDASLHSLVATGCIFIWQNILPEITFQRWSNPDSEEYSYRDYFMVMESIFIRQDLQSGIIFIGEKHLNLEECAYNDAFVVEK